MDSEPSSEEGEKYDVPADWDTDINITQKELNQLLSKSHDELDFDGFKL